jgi:hypothetical protein
VGSRRPTNRLRWLSIVSVDQFVNSQRFAGKITSVRVQKMGVTSMLKAKVAVATALGGAALVVGWAVPAQALHRTT